ncbi:speedy protein A [Austrofundulus limnaeus]|nr:PREDICTED: speedy protein A-like [Austrofundulus limnaeus]
MTFVYFKRARFTVDEYTRKNFFIALYLANTMEEDEEESKYEIFPWALGKNWRRRFPRFLKQRDELWARIQYRAAVSRRCCEEVMAIVHLHFVWQRQRSDHHSGAQRQYGDQDQVRFPRGPFASPVSCSLCNCGSKLHHISSSSDAPPQAVDSPYPHLFTTALGLEFTPVRIPVSHRNAVKDTSEQQKPCCFCPEEVPRESSSCDSIDAFLDWIEM